LRMSEEKLHEDDLEIEDHIIANALGTLMMLSESEPEEFRTNRDQVLQSRAYLLGEQSFPDEHILE